MKQEDIDLIKQEEIFKVYFKYRHSSFNKTINAPDLLYKFKDRISSYNKLFIEMQKNKFKQHKPNEVLIYVKENNETKTIHGNELEVQIKEDLANKEEEKAKVKEQIEEVDKVNQANGSKKKFLILGGYQDIINALLKRGWSRLTDPTDKSFDYIYTLHAQDINFQELNPNQMAGHFWKANEITRKAGLNNNLKNLYYKGIDILDFYPRAYELSEKGDLEDFIEDFKTTKAVSILKAFVNKTRKTSLSEEMLLAAMGICQRKLPLFIGEIENIQHRLKEAKRVLPYQSQSDNNGEDLSIKLITDREWEIIGEEDMKEYYSHMTKLERQKKIGFKMDKAKRSTSEIAKGITNDQKKSSNESQITIIEEVKKDNELKEKAMTMTITTTTNDALSKYIPEIQALLEKIKASMGQYALDGENNIWISKPGGLSRGRGITCINSLNEVLGMLKICNQTILQKYIENPLIILGRKFDIRQWVLVTDLAPLTIWLFDTPYLRFGAEDFKIDEFKNVFSHLTNNSIVKYSEKFTSDHKIEEDMWEIESFRSFLNDKYKRDCWPEIQTKIKQIVIYSLQSAKHKIMHRKNSHEVYGYDLMVDEDLNVYLIEINASPAWDYSTQVTKKLVKIMSEDIISVVVDLEEQKQLPIEQRKDIDTGRLKLIFSGSDFQSISLPNKHHNN